MEYDKTDKLPGLVICVSNPSTQEDCCEFKASPRNLEKLYQNNKKMQQNYEILMFSSRK